MNTQQTEIDKSALLRAAQVLGGQVGVARACGYDDRRHVWPWFNEPTRRIPADKCPDIEAATRAAAQERGDPSLVVLCEELRPDVKWSVLREPLEVPADAEAG